MIVDTSAVLALLFNEPTAVWVATQLSASQGHQMSTVNLAECLIRIRDLKPTTAVYLIDRLYAMDLTYISPTTEQAELVAIARTTYPLNFGDCFAYALAKSMNLPLLTLDADFRKTDLTILAP
jgi:ribonuclease VapC